MSTDRPIFALKIELFPTRITFIRCVISMRIYITFKHFCKYGWKNPAFEFNHFTAIQTCNSDFANFSVTHF